MEEYPAPFSAGPLPAYSTGERVVRARIVVPVAHPAIENGAVVIRGNRITQVGSWKEIAANHSGEIIDCGEVILMPGLVNAHCHLDYTNMAGRLPPQKLFTDWITLMLAAKAEWIYTEFAESWLHGAQMLLRTGTTTVADFEAVPELLPDVWSATPLRVLSLLEMTGVRSRRAPRHILDEALERADHLHDERSWMGLAPHAPYSTPPELIRISADAARERSIPLSIHLAESSLEFEMFRNSRGTMFDWLRRNERDMADCGNRSPVQAVGCLGALGSNVIAVHVNYIEPGDAALLAENGTHVVHCPRSHFYFQHGPFPFHDLMSAGVNICLGTDSLATVYKRPHETVELSLFEEMECFAGKFPDVAPDAILRMSTINGARALGMSGHTGELSAGALADFITIDYAGAPAEAENAIVHHQGHVRAAMINGAWAFGCPV